MDMSAVEYCQNALEAMAADRTFSTNELHPPNNFYGHAQNIKAYAGYDGKQTIKAVVEHGLGFDDNVWSYDLGAPLPAMLVSSPERAATIMRQSNKHVIPIGPMVHYAQPLNDFASVGQKAKPGDTVLLVFPAHSTHHTVVNFNDDLFFKEIERVGREFDHVRICMYWRDIQLDRWRPYAAQGYEVVTAGHMFDALFSRRLKAILTGATLTMYNNFCSAMSYSILMDIPVYYWFTKISFSAESQEDFDRAEFNAWQSGTLAAGNIIVRDAFSELRSDISAQQRDVSRRFFGTEHTLAPAEMAATLEWLDRLHALKTQGE